MNSTAFRKQHSAKNIISIAHPTLKAAHLPAPDLLSLAVGKLQELGLGNLAVKLKVLWNPRMRSTAGLAYPTTTQIVLNPKLQHFGKEEVEGR